MLKEIRLAGYFRNAERFTTSGKDDTHPLFVFLYVLLSFILINLSSFNVKLMLLVTVFSLTYSAWTRNLRRVRSSVMVAIPFLIFFSLSSLILTSDLSNMLKASLFLLTIIILGSLMLNLRMRNLIACLSSLRLPKKITIALLLAIRMLNIYSRDLANLIEIHAVNETRRIEFYRRVVKAGMSVIILRAISLAENLYLRDTLYHFPPSNLPLKIHAKEAYFLFSSFGILFYYVLSFPFPPI